MRANQFWRDASDEFCPQIHVTMDFLCQGCQQGWQIVSDHGVNSFKINELIS
jgi:hypothetical protein